MPRPRKTHPAIEADAAYDAVPSPALMPPVDAPTSPPPAPSPAPGTKTDMVLALLGREQGATVAEMMAVTGWLAHTTRAALTGLRKKGHALMKSKRDDVTCYRLAAAD